jgi:ferric-dicitrate binding protein FerR (iron transport regulator)
MSGWWLVNKPRDLTGDVSLASRFLSHTCNALTPDNCLPCMADDTSVNRGPVKPPAPDEAELALWERFLAGESSYADEAVIRRWSADGSRTEVSSASVRQALHEALSLAGDPPTVDIAAMLGRLRKRLAQEPAAAALHRVNAPHDRRQRVRRVVATTVAWATAAAIIVLATARGSDASTQWVRLGPRDTGTYRAGPYERLHMRLADGSDVVVAPNTTVRISGPTDRQSLYVRGEAYVDSKQDDGRSLLVHAANAVLENAGARFAIRTDSDDKEVRIAVETGVVLAGDSGAPWQTARVLTRGTFGVVPARGPTRTFRPADPDDALVWEAGGVHWGRDQLRDELPRVSWNGA